MTPSQAQDAVGYLASLFPTIAKFWSPERRTLLVEKLIRIEITPEQFRAAAGEHRSTVKGPFNEGELVLRLRACVPTTHKQHVNQNHDCPVFGDHNHDAWAEYVAAVESGDITHGPVNQDVLGYARGMLRDTGAVPSWRECVEATKPVPAQERIDKPSERAVAVVGGPDAAEFDALVGTSPKAAAARPETVVTKIREGS